MADSEKAAAPSATKESSNANANAKYLVRTTWPHVSFDLPDDDVPMITSEGTRLTKAQLDAVEASAAKHDVGLSVEEVK